MPVVEKGPNENLHHGRSIGKLKVSIHLVPLISSASLRYYHGLFLYFY